MTGVASQFGIDASYVRARPEQFRGHGSAQVTGLHLYMGTNIDDEDILMRQFTIGAGLAARLAPEVGRLTEVDLGGGFGAPYARSGDRARFGGLTTRLARLLDAQLPGWRVGSPRIAFESGRYLVGSSGTLLCRVMDVKVSKGETFVVLDAGVNHLGGMSGLRRLPPLVPSIEPQSGAEQAETVRCTVVGPLCTPLDVLARGMLLPAPRPGQVVAIPNAGAYGLTASLLGFLGHPAPSEVVVDGDDVLSVSRLQLARSAAVSEFMPT
jgi:diaminopimelate decarboxylase